jgi:hypothetical protein
MKIKLNASVSKETSAGGLKLTARLYRASEVPSWLNDAVGVYLDQHLVEGVSEDAELDLWFVQGVTWDTQGDQRSTCCGTATGQMAFMFPDGSGVDGEFQALIDSERVTNIIFTTSAEV